MDEPNDQNLTIDPIASPSARGLRVQAGVFSVVSVLILAGLSVNCIFFQQGVQRWHVLAILVPILALHFWFAWRIGRRTIQLLDDRCIVRTRFGPFSLSQTFRKHALTDIKASRHTDHETTDTWMVQLQSQQHIFSVIYLATLINRFGRYPDWQPIMIAHDRNIASDLCVRIAAWANMQFDPETV